MNQNYKCYKNLTPMMTPKNQGNKSYETYESLTPMNYSSISLRNQFSRDFLSK